MAHEQRDVDLGRRRLLRAAVISALVGTGAQAALPFASAKNASGPTDLSPDAALKKLVDGNQRATTGKLTSIERDLAILREHTVNKQEPFAAVLSCADSRVPVEMIFDQTIGDIFVTRVAGNIVTPEIIASLAFKINAGMYRGSACNDSSTAASEPLRSCLLKSPAAFW